MSVAVILRLLAAVEEALPVTRPQAPTIEDETSTVAAKSTAAKKDFTKFAMQMPAFLTTESSAPLEEVPTEEAKPEEPPKPPLERIAELADVHPLQFGSSEDMAYGLVAIKGCWIVEAVVRFRLNSSTSSSGSGGHSSQSIPLLSSSSSGQKTEKSQTHRIHKNSPVLLQALQSVVDAVKLAAFNVQKFVELTRCAAASCEQDANETLVDATSLRLLTAAQRALAFANAVLHERSPPQSSAGGDSCIFVPKLPATLSISVTVERLGIALYIYSRKTPRQPAILYAPSPALAFLSAMLIDALQHIQLLIRNVQAELNPEDVLLS